VGDALSEATLLRVAQRFELHAGMSQRVAPVGV